MSKHKLSEMQSAITLARQYKSEIDLLKQQVRKC